jgi:hypothetical protein
MIRDSKIQEILIQLLFDLTMKNAMAIRLNHPELTDSQVMSKMIQEAYDKAAPEVTSKIMLLTYDETVYLEIQMQHMAHKSIRYHDAFAEMIQEVS